MYRYLQYLKSFDLSTGFYFSDTYDLCDTFQTNVVALINDKAEGDRTKIYTCSQSEPIKNYNEVFMWNYYIISEFHKLLKNRRWVLGFIHGYVEQISSLYTYTQTDYLHRDSKTSAHIPDSLDRKEI